MLIYVHIHTTFWFQSIAWVKCGSANWYSYRYTVLRYSFIKLSKFYTGHGFRDVGLHVGVLAITWNVAEISNIQYFCCSNCISVILSCFKERWRLMWRINAFLKLEMKKKTTPRGFTPPSTPQRLDKKHVLG